MQCASCGRENATAAEFCGGCGAKVAPPAASYNSPPPPNAPFTNAPPPNTPPNAPPYDSAPQSPYGWQPPAPPLPDTGFRLVCVSGPDQGKQFALGPSEVILGRTPASGLLSSDPDVAPQHAAFVLHNGQVWFRALDNAGLWANGMPAPSGILTPGVQLRIGRSFWQMITPQMRTKAGANLFETVGAHVGAFAGVDRLENLNAGEMFGSVLQARTDEDAETLFGVGTPQTTPPLNHVSTAWPKPWLFFKTLTLALLVYLGFVFTFNQTGNPNIIPGLLMVGSFAVPLSMVIFYFEMNAPQNVSLYQVVKMVLVGGILSIAATLLFQSVLNADHSSSLMVAILAGTTEEIGKLVALLVVVNRRRYRWTLNGLLLGGAVGAGFAGFESAGYALRVLLAAHGMGPVYQVILLRGLLSPGGHVAWAALYGAALWKVKGERPFSLGMLQDTRFLRVIGLAMALHVAWDVPLGGLLDLLKDVALLFIALIAVLTFVQDGLKQIRTAQEAETAVTGVAQSASA